MRLLIFFFFMLVFTAEGFSQIDKSSTPVKAPGELLSPKNESNNSSVKSTGNHSLSTKNGIFSNTPETRKLGEKEEKSFSMRTDNGLLTYKEKDFTPKAFKEDKEIRPEFKGDQYLGDFITDGSYVELYCRDHEYVDGDKVRIYLNGEVVQNSVSLGAGYTPIFVKLNSGLNNVEFEALNQGASGPNTAELRVFDAKGIEVTRKEWNLLTGGKASLIVVKQ